MKIKGPNVNFVRNYTGIIELSDGASSVDEIELIEWRIDGRFRREKEGGAAFKTRREIYYILEDGSMRTRKIIQKQSLKQP
jgi:hypothetical protein